MRFGRDDKPSGMPLIENQVALMFCLQCEHQTQLPEKMNSFSSFFAFRSGFANTSYPAGEIRN
jgi:hypothetical protein